MAGYQLTATELALAYDRAQHGQMEPEAFDIRRERSLDAMRQAAAVLRGRQPTSAAAVLGPGWQVRDVAAAAARPPGRPWPRPSGAGGGPSEEDDD